MKIIIHILCLMFSGLVEAGTDSCLEKVQILKAEMEVMPREMYSFQKGVWSENGADTIMLSISSKLGSSPLASVWAVITTDTDKQWVTPVSLYKDENVFLAGPIIMPSDGASSLRLVATYEKHVACEGKLNKLELPYAIPIT